MRKGAGAVRPLGARRWAGLSALAALAAASGAARAEGLGGTWTAGAMSERWAVGDWGEPCGPKPGARGAPATEVTIIEHGGELAFSGGGYPRTSACYEAGLGVKVRAHTAGARAWRTECSSDPNDSRQARLVTKVSAPNDATIVFDETGEYQFLIKGQNCTASVRRSRTYVRGRPTAEAPPPAPPSAPPPEPATPPAPPPARCESVGEPAKLEVRPQRKLLRPGQSFAFRAVVLDAAGCRVPQAPAWSVVNGAEGVTVGAAGNVSVPAAAPEGDVVLQASVGARSVRVTVEVVGEGRYAELLADRNGGWTDGGERGEVAEVVLSTPRIGAVTVTAPDQRGQRRALFLAVVAASATALAVVGLVLRRRRGAAAARRDEGGDAPPAARAPASAPPPAAGAEPAPQPEKVCPVCGLRYGADALYGGQEGAMLVVLNER
ncbi:MAG TPA: hypothetical protein VFS43_33975 [Polyangiaceae bacterium]|nr:hypothetical protein [Polyangiaceae bacterium]